MSIVKDNIVLNLSFLRWRFYSIPCRASYFASVELKETVEFNRSAISTELKQRARQICSAFCINPSSLPSGVTTTESEWVLIMKKAGRWQNGDSKRAISPCWSEIMATKTGGKTCSIYWWYNFQVLVKTKNIRYRQSILDFAHFRAIKKCELSLSEGREWSGWALILWATLHSWYDL